MKKLLLGLCVAALFSAPVMSAESVKITVSEEEKAKFEAQIKYYQDAAKKEISKAEADIKAAQEKFDRVKVNSEKTISSVTTQIKKLQADAENAKQEFERAREEANMKIDESNKRIQKANEDLRRNIQSVAEAAGQTVKDTKETKGKK